jgi:peptide-methionine (S)-S-oxide reductase
MTMKAQLQLLCSLAAIVSTEAFVNGYIVTCELPRKTILIRFAKQQATFGMGCFWKPSEELLKIPGVLDTTVGYTGNKNTGGAPTYASVCAGRGWVEGVRVEYDDELITYEELLDAFFKAQQPQFGSRQYASIVFPETAEQEAAATAWLATNTNRVRKDGVSTAMTTVEAKTPFFRAENYHQRYWQKTRPRVAVLIGLMSIGSGILDRFTPGVIEDKIHSVANAFVLAGLIFVLLERYVDTNVVQLD